MADEYVLFFFNSNTVVYLSLHVFVVSSKQQAMTDAISLTV